MAKRKAGKSKSSSPRRKKSTATLAVNPKTERQYQIEGDAQTLLRAAEVTMSAGRFKAAKVFLVKQQKAVKSVIRMPKNNG